MYLLNIVCNTNISSIQIAQSTYIQEIQGILLISPNTHIFKYTYTVTIYIYAL